MNDIYLKFIFLGFLTLSHPGLLNKLEKVFMKIFINNDSIINRPLDSCKNSYDFNVFCVGMPSGHTEIATIISLLLNHYDLLPQSIAILTIVVTGLQRIVTKMHTSLQVFIGLLFGIAYTHIYVKIDSPIKSMLIITGVILLSILILTLYIDNIVQNDKIPDWVDKSLYPIIEKKKNVPFYLKYGTVALSLHYEDVPLFIDYKTLELYLDKCIIKINNSNIKYDGIVGIKTGGAIISKYIAEKLNIKNYTVKITKKANECESNNLKFAGSISDNIMNIRKDNKLCEGIDDNLENKNIILIDEQVETGATMEFVANYLKDVKKVNNLYLITITSTNGDIKLNNIPLNYIKNYKYSLIYPWGYDN
jgi:hypoxanthine phosphoribosyltransferase